MSAYYKNTISILTAISKNRPLAKAPPNYNLDYLITNPLYIRSSPLLKPCMDKSLRYESSTLDKTGELDNMPLPKVLVRQIVYPSPSLLNSSKDGKLCGYRVTVTGRRGTRTSTQTVNYGRLHTGSIDSSAVDFGLASFVGKRGSTGVRAWVSFGR